MDMSREFLIYSFLLIVCGVAALRLPGVEPATVPMTRLQIVAESGPDGEGRREFLRTEHTGELEALALTEIVRGGPQP
jgi:hypothetical protein